MKKYFAKNAFQNQAHNKAEEAVQKCASELNGTLIHGDENLKVFVNRFKNAVDEICTKFPRCRYIDTSYKYYENSGHWISAGDVARIDFYEVKQEFPEHAETFICIGCGHELPADCNIRTKDFCFLCDPDVTLQELLQDKTRQCAICGNQYLFSENLCKECFNSLP